MRTISAERRLPIDAEGSKSSDMGLLTLLEAARRDRPCSIAMRLFRRRRFLTHQFQYRLLAVNLIYTSLIILLFTGALFGPPTEQLLSGDVSRSTLEEAAAQFLALDDRIWMPLLFMICCFAVHFVFLSHRIAGPLYQLRRLFGEVGDGNFAVRATLRKRDYLLTEATAVNDMIERVGTRLADIDERATELHVGLQSLRSAIHSGSKEDILVRLGSLEENCTRLSAMLGAFNLSPAPGRSETPTPRRTSATAPSAPSSGRR